MEPVFGQLLATLMALWWPFVRVLAVLSFMPVIGDNLVPVTVRVLLALALAVVLLPVAAPPQPVSPFSLLGIVTTVEQVAIGLIIGLGAAGVVLLIPMSFWQRYGWMMLLEPTENAFAVRGRFRLAETRDRNAWAAALGQSPAALSGETLLRLEMAAEVPTPAEHLSDRRLLQLTLLTRRNAPAPAETWGKDVAAVLGSAHEAAAARRLQAVLKALLKR